jgi:predicted phosphodiesterase
MKIALGSDLHLEFEDLFLKNDEKADGLILAGDIMVADPMYKQPRHTQAEIDAMHPAARNPLLAFRFRNFLSRVSFQFPWTIMIAGNHEYYHGKWPSALNILRAECAHFPNIYFLENEVKVIEDITFIGCTLWTNMGRGNPHSMYHATTCMNDYHVIRNENAGYTRLRPAHTMAAHRTSLEYIKTVVAEKHDQKFVVVGHHAPTPLSVHEMYKHDVLMNDNFYSDLSEFIMDRPQIKVWIHGHTHHPFDYKMGETRIVCNPRGYPQEFQRHSAFKLQHLDI